MYDGYAEHAQSAAGSRADSCVYAALSRKDPLAWEQLPSRQIASDTIEICAIPFFVYDLALGDVVSTSAVQGHGIVDRRIERVVARSGHETYRVRFLRGASADDEEQNLTAFLRRLGLPFERWSPSMIAIDADGDRAQLVADYLWERRRETALDYETGRTV